MMKMAGCLLIVGATSSWGVQKAKRLQEEVDNLRYLQRIVYILQSEIGYSRSFLGEIFYEIAHNTKEPYRSWLVEMSERADFYEGATFEDIWKSSIEKHFRVLHFPARELDTLKSLGNQLGCADIQIQLKLLDLYLEHLKHIICEVQEEIKGKTRLYHCLGLMSGLLISIVLF